MAYGDYHGPDKPNKGREGGACNRRLCQAEPALHYNHGSYSWYCRDCAIQIGQDPVNLRGWNRDWLPKVGHPQFETREQIQRREAAATGNVLEIGPRSQMHDPAVPDGLRAVTLHGAIYPTLASLLNAVREDAGGVAWPGQFNTQIPEQWVPALKMMENATGQLSSTRRPPEADNLPAQTISLIPEPNVHFLETELGTFGFGEETLVLRIAKRNIGLHMANLFLNDFHEGWPMFAPANSKDAD